MKAGFNTEQLCEGVFTELSLEDPVTGKDLPLWVSSYALAEYGTGIIKCSAHDERDFAFAKKYQLPLHTVLLPLDPSLQEGTKNFEICFTDFANATILEPKEFFGKKPHDVREHIADYLEKMKWGNKSVQYTLKDWVFARQRYWGEPFPIVFDANHKPYVVADCELPVRLPQVEEYEPTGTGESPLANIREWVEVFGQINDDGEFETLDKTDPRAKPFTRETNTMPQWAGSSWYYLRYIDPKNSRELINKEKDKKWSPVDFYVGGAEHATRHLIYARFWHKFLYDIGVVNYDEPFTRLQNVGLILAEDGRKMSKRWGNVINPDDMVERFGADTLRMYEMFMGPFDQAIAWSTESMMGSRRFIEKIWDYVYAWESGRVTDDKIDLSESQNNQIQKWREEVDTLLHKTIKKVGDDIEQFKFNTAISSLMIFINKVRTELPPGITPSYALALPQLSQFLRLLAPFAPHVSEELWQMIGESGSIHTATWPSYDVSKLVTSHFTVAIQINGKLRDTIEITANMGEQEVLKQARERSIIKKWIAGKNVVKYIYIENKLVNIVVSD
jgi:leucyl-tRNA synthetase